MTVLFWAGVLLAFLTLIWFLEAQIRRARRAFRRRSLVRRAVATVEAYENRSVRT